MQSWQLAAVSCTCTLAVCILLTRVFHPLHRHDAVRQRYTTDGSVPGGGVRGVSSPTATSTASPSPSGSSPTAGGAGGIESVVRAVVVASGWSEMAVFLAVADHWRRVPAWRKCAFQ